MTIDIEKLEYRPNVGLMIFNDQGLVWSGLCCDDTEAAFGTWQMPQGGIDAGETAIEAAMRELNEETGLLPEHVKVIAQTGEYSYELPLKCIPTLWNGRYRGQKQHWFALQMTAPDSAVNLEHEKPEFSEWQWKSAAELVSEVVDFKKEVYACVFADFAAHLS